MVYGARRQAAGNLGNGELSGLLAGARKPVAHGIASRRFIPCAEGCYAESEGQSRAVAVRSRSLKVARARPTT
jgi:hypothetical protein